MAAFRLILCTVVATIWFCSLSNAAVVHNLIYADGLVDGNNYDDGNDYGAESFNSFPGNMIRDRRSIETSSEKVCHGSMPCGWAVYVPFTRRVDYFMKNTCNCSSPLRCIRTDDDLSVSAYVYRCRREVTATDIESPTEGPSN